MKTRVKIDSRYCDVEEGFVPPKNIVHFSDEECAQGGSRSKREVRFRLPASPQNDALMEYAADAFAAERFNAANHTATIEVDGVELLSGKVALAAVVYNDNMVQYEVVVTQQGDSWREQ